MSASERQFQAEIAASIEPLEAYYGTPVWYQKIPDAPRGSTHRFMSVRWYDCYVLVHGLMVVLELKMTHGPSIAFDALRGEQEVALQKVAAAGAPAYVVVCFRFARKGEPVIEAYAIPIAVWMAEQQTSVRASLAYDWVREHAVALPWRKGHWDLRPLLDRLLEPATPPPVPSEDPNQGLLFPKGDITP
jgi:penicillin-binding protein-related factor A (putative recombinase)